jgi:predicted acylesterase/phospholipase RssA
MRLFQAAMLACGALALSGCATRGAINVSCKAFDQSEQGIVFALPKGRLVQQIQQESLSGTVAVLPASDQPFKASAVPDDDPLAAAIRTAIEARIAEKKDAGALLTEASAAYLPKGLLLSGGGQWGSFGASFLRQLYIDQGPSALDYTVISGVSTGGLQSIFVAIGDQEVSAAESERFLRFLASPQGAGIKHREGDAVRYIDLLAMNYSPKAESDIVNRNPQLLAVATGSFAGLKPLRKRIEAALCSAGEPAEGNCPLIDRLAASNKAVLIGFVRADDGAFIVADAVKIAKLAKQESSGGYAAARDCLTGAALASAAMPVTFQQVRVDGRAYLDGGVRQSVFDSVTMQRLDSELVKYFKVFGAVPRPSAIDVVRNGPTALTGGLDDKINRSADAISAAQRAQGIVVNQLEVGSIAALRIDRPTGPIRLVTADGYKAGVAGWTEACRKDKEDVMFDPKFMACLRRFGAFKAGRKLGEPLSPWLYLSEIRPAAEENTAPQAGSTASGESGR